MKQQKVKNSLSLVNTLLAKKYSIDRQLGQGLHSEVYLGLNIKDRTHYAIKFYNFDLIDSQNQIAEIRSVVKKKINIMKNLKTRHILKCYDVYENFRYLAYVTDYAPSTLADQVNQGPINVEKCKNILKQIMLGINSLLQEGIIMRRLQPKHIFHKNGVYKIGDFGLNEVMFENNEEVNSIWVAPENKLNFNKLSLKSYVWSIGVLLLFMLNRTQKSLQFPDIKTQHPQLQQFLFRTVTEENRIPWNEVIGSKIFQQEQKATLFKQFMMSVFLEGEPCLEEDLCLDVQELRKQLILEDLNIETRKFSFVVLGRSDISIYNQKIQNEEDKLFQLAKRSHFQAKKTEFLMHNLIQPICNFKLLDSSRENLQFIYLLVSRCFRSISNIETQIKKQSTENTIIKDFMSQTHSLYQRCFVLFQKYSSALTKKQGQFFSIVQDKMAKTSEVKEVMLNGIEGKDYEPIQHLYYIEINYIQAFALKRLLKKNYYDINRLIQILENYREINLLTEKCLEEMTLSEKIEEMFQKNRKNSIIHKKH